MRYTAIKVQTAPDLFLGAVLDTTDGSTALFGDVAEEVAEEFNAGIGAPPELYIWREAGFWETYAQETKEAHRQ